MIKELIKIANELDARGLSKESDLVDKIIKSAWSPSEALGFEKDEMDHLEEAEKQKLEQRWKAHQAKMRQVMAGRLKEAWLWFNENLFVSSTDDQSKFPITIEKDLTIGLGQDQIGAWRLSKMWDYLNYDTKVIILPAGTTIKSIDQDLNKVLGFEPSYFDEWFGQPKTTLRYVTSMLKRSIQGNSDGDYIFALPELKKKASYLDAMINKDASFIPKKIEPFRVKIMEGRFKGGEGMAVDRYDDGVFGVDLDEPLIVDERETDRGFAMEDQIERIDAADSFERDASSSLEKEVSEGPSLTWVDRGDWGDAKASLRKHEVVPEPGTEGLDRMEQRDLDAIQSALDQDPESEAGYLVINPWDAADFRMFVQDQMDHPEGKQIAVPLNTFEVEGKRINFFKINDWTNPKGDRFGKVEEKMKKIAADRNYRMFKKIASSQEVEAIWNSMSEARKHGKFSAPIKWDAGPLSQEIEFRWLGFPADPPEIPRPVGDVQWRFSMGSLDDSWRSCNDTEYFGPHGLDERSSKAFLWDEQKDMIKALRQKRDMWRAERDA